MKKMMTLLSIMLIVLISYISVQNPLTDDYLMNLKNGATTVSVMTDKQNLKSEIIDYANKHDVKPIDARIDQVWKAIPGYNGFIVDVDASYKRMKKKGKFDESLIVYKQVQPATSLDDLLLPQSTKGIQKSRWLPFL